MRPFYRWLRRHNRRVFLGAFGMDRYWVKAGLDCQTFRYSDFNLGSQVRQRADNDIWIAEWLHGEKGRLNTYIAQDCDGIVAGLYEYDAPIGRIRRQIALHSLSNRCKARTLDRGLRQN